jgi:ATP-dependent DNA helicase RecG
MSGYHLLWENPPVRYRIYRVCSINEALSTDEEVIIRAVVVLAFTTDKGQLILTVEDDTGTLKVVFYGYTNYHLRMCKQGAVVYLAGRIKNEQMQHPAILKEPPESSVILKPVYRKGIKGQSIKRALARFIPDGYEILPREITEDWGIPDLRECFRMVHLPRTPEEAEWGRWCLALREACMEMLKYSNRPEAGSRGYVITGCADEAVDYLQKKTGYTLTPSQIRVIGEIFDDLSSPYAMRRILSGDVGTGKTLVAAAAIYGTVSGGFRVLYICPTEVLAVQTYYTLARLFAGVAFVELSTSARKMRKSGKLPDVIVGTHSLLYENFDGWNVGLVVIDEQHRFGVRQKEQLIYDRYCNMLEISATPIPRTISLMLEGLVSFSRLEDCPYRRRVETQLIFARSEEFKQKRKEILDTVHREVESGNQVLIIHPSVSSSRRGIPVLAGYRYWKRKYGLAVEVLHGKMKDKAEVIQRFRRGETRILVSTTAAEVGIDVDNLTVCVVSGAERFGLTQLHQIRGRVGRRGQRGYFYMIARSKSDRTAKRLEVLCRTEDGLKIAEEDARLRGVGRISDVYQAGHFFRYLRLEDVEIFNIVKRYICRGMK